MVPIRNVPIALKSNFLELNELMSQALIGIIMPLTNKKPVVNHCTVDAEILNSFIKVGKAVASKV